MEKNTHAMDNLEKDIQNELFRLIRTAGKRIQVDLIDHYGHRINDTCSGLSRDCEKPKNEVKKSFDRVILTLIEPKTTNDLSEWADRIAKAWELVKDLEKEMIWRTTNPNFFQAVLAQYNLEK